MAKANTLRNRAPAASPAKPDGQPWFSVRNVAEAGYAEIKLRGYIGMPKEGYDYWTGEEYETEGAGTLKDFERELEALGNVKKIQLSIFSEGGDVFTGMAIHNLLRRHPAKKLCVIDGVCASAATYPALACETIQIPSNAWMMIHATSCWASGNAAALRSMCELLEQMDKTLINLYAKRTGKSDEEIKAMIQAETWMDGQTAVEQGFADVVVEPLQNLATRAGTLTVTNRAMLTNAPSEVLALFDMTRPTNAEPKPTPEAMLKIQTVLMNSAADPASGGGGGGGAPAPAAPAATPSPAAPAAAPAAPAAPAAAVVVVAPEVPAAAPQNLTLDQVQGFVTAAVTNAVKPLQDEIARLNGLGAHGITPQNLGGTNPVTGAQPGQSEQPKPLDFKNMTPLQLLSAGRKTNAAAKTA